MIQQHGSNTWTIPQYVTIQLNVGFYISVKAGVTEPAMREKSKITVYVKRKRRHYIPSRNYDEDSFNIHNIPELSHVASPTKD